MLFHCEEGLWYCITIFEFRHGGIWKALLSIPRGAFCIKQGEMMGRQLGAGRETFQVLTMRTKYRVHVEHK